MASGPFTIAQLAQAVGMTVDEVRFYRDGGLLQPPRRRRSRRDDMAFFPEHVERLHFIQNALTCGLTRDDIAKFIDRSRLLTCGDVYALAGQRLTALDRSGRGDTPAAVCLSRLREQCAQKGSREECPILKALSEPDC